MISSVVRGFHFDGGCLESYIDGGSGVRTAGFAVDTDGSMDFAVAGTEFGIFMGVKTVPQEVVAGNDPPVMNVGLLQVNEAVVVSGHLDGVLSE